MALKFLVFLALLKLAISDPDPNPDTNVRVNVGVNVQNDDPNNGCECSKLCPPGFWIPSYQNSPPCPPGSIQTCISRPGGICCQEISIDCVFWGKAYPNKAYLEDSCMELQCINGTWNYTGKVHRGEGKCAECQVLGEPHIVPYDQHNVPSIGGYRYSQTSKGVYNYQGAGTYAITQPGFGIHEAFGVNANFTPCLGTSWTCVSSVKYYEPGIEVIASLPPVSKNCQYHLRPLLNPACDIKVFVNGVQVTIGKTVHLLYGSAGTVLVFRHNHYGKADPTADLSCVNIVGSKGLSVSLCLYKGVQYSNLWVWAWPSLKNKLHGICGSFTENIHDYYTARNTSHQTDATAFADTWQIENININQRSVFEDKCLNEIVLAEITATCNNITRGICDKDPIYCEGFIAACIFDLCMVPDDGSYVEGYKQHLAVLCHLTYGCVHIPFCWWCWPFCQCCLEFET